MNFAGFAWHTIFLGILMTILEPHAQERCSLNQKFAAECKKEIAALIYESRLSASSFI